MPEAGYEQVQKSWKIFRKKGMLEDNLVEKFFLDNFTALKVGWPYGSTPSPTCYGSWGNYK